MSIPASWQQAWDDAQPRIQAIRESIGHMPTTPAQTARVGQLDAEILDQELLQLLKEPINKALGLFSTGWESLIEPELTLILQLLLYKYSIWESGATYGAKLQSLRYATSKPLDRHTRLTRSGLPARLLLMHGTITVLLPYASKRIRGHALSNSWPDAPSYDRRRKLWNALTKLESVHGSLSLLSFIMFLWNGRYRTMADRILGLKLVPSTALLNRNVSYEFMNRQMVWHAFTEFLLFLLPIINTRSMRRRISRTISNLRWTDLIPLYANFRSTEEEGPQETARHGKYYILPESDCAICAEDASFDLSLLKDSGPSIPVPSHQNYPTTDVTTYPTKYPINTPYRASCGHVYCYVCISDRLLRAADEGEKYWECLRCEERVVGANRWEPAKIRGRRLRSVGEEEGDSRLRWGSVAGSNVSRLGHSYGTSDLNDSELSAMDFDSVSSIGLKTHSGSDDLSE